MEKERIELTDSPQAILMKLAEGNPGALNAMINIMQQNAKIDPDSAFGQFSALLSLDSYGIYGTDIYVLYNDICKNSVPKTIAVLRACQLGLFNNNVLKDACSRQDRSGCELVPVDELYNKVKEELQNFDKE